MNIREEKIKEIIELKNGEKSSEEYLMEAIFGYSSFAELNKDCTDEENILRYCIYNNLSFKGLTNIVDNPTEYSVKEMLDLAYANIVYKKTKKQTELTESEKTVLVNRLYELTNHNPEKYFNMRLIKKVAKEYYKIQNKRFVY